MIVNKSRKIWTNFPHYNFLLHKGILLSELPRLNQKYKQRLHQKKKREFMAASNSSCFFKELCYFLKTNSLSLLNISCHSSPILDYFGKNPCYLVYPDRALLSRFRLTCELLNTMYSSFIFWNNCIKKGSSWWLYNLLIVSIHLSWWPLLLSYLFTTTDNSKKI